MKGIRSVWKWFKTFERDSNANFNHSNQIRHIQMQILTIWTAFECKFESFERDSSIRIQIWTVRMGFEAFECKFEPFERDSKHSNVNSNHLKVIRSIRMQILTIRTKFEAFECKFKPFKWNSQYWNVNSNFSKGIQSSTALVD